MLDRKYQKMGEQVDRKVSAATVAIEEGACLVEVIEAGEAKVAVKASVDGSEKVAGFAILPFSLPSQAVATESLAPTASALQFQLRNNNLVSGSVRAIVAGGADLTVDAASFSATPSAGTVKVDLAGGRVKFAAGDAGKAVTLIYRHALTVVQARQRYHERAINNRDLVGSMGIIGVAKGYVELATDQFDTSKDYSSGDLKLGANGMLTIGGAGPAIPNGKVLALPDASGSAQGPFLRISALIG